MQTYTARAETQLLCAEITACLPKVEERRLDHVSMVEGSLRGSRDVNPAKFPCKG